MVNLIILFDDAVVINTIVTQQRANSIITGCSHLNDLGYLGFQVVCIVVCEVKE